MTPGLPQRITTSTATPATAQEVSLRSLFHSSRVVRPSHARSRNLVREFLGHTTGPLGMAYTMRQTRMIGGHRTRETVATTTITQRIQAIMNMTTATRDMTNLRVTAAQTLTFQTTSLMRTIVVTPDHLIITSTMVVSMTVRDIEPMTASAPSRVRPCHPLRTDYPNDLLHPLPGEDVMIRIAHTLLTSLQVVVAMTRIMTIMLVLLALNTYRRGHVRLTSCRTAASHLYPLLTQSQLTIFREPTGNSVLTRNYACPAGLSIGRL